MKILDCTLRDGGYYTNWDFDKQQVDQYLEACNDLPIDYIEIGYRSPVLKDYHGKYFYLPLYELQDLRKRSNKKLVIILNEKDVRVEHLEELLRPIVGLVDMVRMAIDPNNLRRAIELAKAVKTYGFEVGFNVMYMSKWKDNLEFIDALGEVDGVADYFYMVDSYGGVFPQDVKDIIDLVRSKTTCPLGFHGHDNLELALVNTLTAIENGVEIVDATILGMGRGAGNLKTELLLTVLNKENKFDLDFTALESAVSAISPLLEEYQWGTNLPYMISGSNSLPQKDVMDWVSTRFYSLNTIVRALDNQSNKIKDNEQFSVAEFQQFNKVLVVGGGPSVGVHKDGLLDYLKRNPEVAIIHASSKNAAFFKELENKQFFCLVGNEGKRLEKTFKSLAGFNGVCIMPPFPRKMGTYVPDVIRDQTFELDQINVSDQYLDAHTTLALQIADNIKASTVYVVGYDGYKDMVITEKEKNLNEENAFLFNKFSNHLDGEMFSLTPSYYSFLDVKSIYSLI